MVAEWRNATFVTKLVEVLRVYTVWGDSVSTLKTFERFFKVYYLVSVYPKNMKLVQMTNINVIFYVVVPVYRLVEIWNSPQFPAQFRNGL